MPGLVIRIGPEDKRPIARCALRTPGQWDQLDDAEKAAWNKASTAINELMYLVHAKCRELPHWNQALT